MCQKAKMSGSEAKNLPHIRAAYAFLPEAAALSDATLLTRLHAEDGLSEPPLATALISLLERIKGPLPEHFDEAFYLSSHIDVAEIFDIPRGGVIHYLTSGRDEGRVCSPSDLVRLLESIHGEAPTDFDEGFYLSIYRDVSKDSCFPQSGAIHYLQKGRQEGRFPNVNSLILDLEAKVGQLPTQFDETFYIAYNSDILADYHYPGGGAVHYLQKGRVEERPFNANDFVMRLEAVKGQLPPGFNEHYYTTRHSDVTKNSRYARAGAIHYLISGREEDREYSASLFAVHDDSRRRPLVKSVSEPSHLVMVNGEARFQATAVDFQGQPNLDEWKRLAIATGLFDVAYYLAKVPVASSIDDALHHYLTIGFKSYFPTGPKFSEADFLSLMPTARQKLVPALVQYALLSSVEQLAFFSRLGEARARDGQEEWVDVGSPLPDSRIALDRMRGFSFFERFGFLFEGESDLPHVLAAVETLAAETPDIQFGVDARPAVSIVMPVYGQLPYVLNCLESLAQQRCSRSFEVLVYDDCSPDGGLMGLLRLIPWISYVRGEANLGFLRACNAAAGLCNGEYLVLLNSDVRVTPDWLKALIDTFDDHPLAGIVGSKLFNADGTLQEAGGVVWADASGHNVGRSDDPNRPEYCYARQVDYCSGAAIAIPMALWNSLGGFDETFAPAYYEDTDLAFRVRKAGRQVWYQPLARALHYEGRTHGRDLETGVKAHQSVNERVFRETWALELASHPPKSTPVREASDRCSRQRLLVLDANVLTPDMDSGSVTTLRLIEAFQALGWSITFAALHNLAYDPDYSARLQRLGVEMLHAPFVQGTSDIIRHRADEYDVVLGLRHNVLFPVYEEFRNKLPLARILFHNMDLHYLRMERAAALMGDRRIASQAEQAHDEESFLALEADCTLVTSQAEETIISEEVPEAAIITYAYTMDVFPGVRSRDERHDILFFGGYRHAPNLDAAEFLVREIWPLVSNKLPSHARLVLAGSDMPDAIRKLAGDRILALGFVPDLREVLEGARVFVAPLRYGAGVKGKLVTALANGLPSVASSIAVEGMGLQGGRETLVADSAEEFTQGISRAYSDAALWAGLQTAGYAFVRQHYSREVGQERCRKALATADDRWLGRRHRLRERMLADTRARGGWFARP